MMGITSSLRTSISSSLVDVACMSLASLAATWTAAQMLTVSHLGIFSVLFAIATVLQTVLQGALGMIVLRSHGNEGRNTYRIVEWISIVMLLIGWCGALLLLFDINAGAWLVYATLMLLFARHALTRAVLTTIGAEKLSATISFIVLSGVLLSVPLALRASSLPFHFVGLIYLVTFTFTFIFSHRAAKPWFSAAGGQSPRVLRLSIEQLLLAGGIQIAGILLVIPLGLTFTAAMRGVSVLMGPVSSLFTALRPILTPRIARREPRDLLRISLVTSAGLLLVSAIWAAVCWFALQWAPNALLGDSAEATTELFWLFATGSILQAGYFGIFLAARSAALDRSLLFTNITFLTIVATSTSIVFITKNALPYFAGTYLSQVISALMLARAIYVHARKTSGVEVA